MQITLTPEVSRLLTDFTTATRAESVDAAAAALITDSISRLVHQHRQLNVWREVKEIRLMDEPEPGPRFEIYPIDDDAWIVKLYNERGQECGAGQFHDHTEALEFAEQWLESRSQAHA